MIYAKTAQIGGQHQQQNVLSLNWYLPFPEMNLNYYGSPAQQRMPVCFVLKMMMEVSRMIGLLLVGQVVPSSLTSRTFRTWLWEILSIFLH